MILTSANSKKKILVISPHGDDEVIGCGGTMALASKEGAEVTLVVMATGGIKHHHLLTPVLTVDRLSEIAASCNRLGVINHRVLFPGHDMRLEALSMLELVTALDEVLASNEYEECYIPDSSHNLDHRRTHEAAIAALRPCGRRPLNLVAVYEGTVASWRSPAEAGGKLYVNIDSTLDTKIAALQEYRSQLRAFPHPTSVEAVRRLASVRGLECGLNCAERFKILQMVRA